MRKLEKEYLRRFRKCQNTNGVLRLFNRFLLRRLSLRTHIQIPYTTKIGDHFSIGHMGPVIINPGTVIGNNVCVNAGVTIGQENRGIRQGCSTIGNTVWIGPNAVVVGEINIGNDVLIAPNAYVNFDVPDHSVVIGNPGSIHYREHATEGYLKVYE